MTGQDIDTRVSGLLTDPLRTRFPLADRLNAINDAILLVCGYKPDACSRTWTFTLAAGTVQSLPAPTSRLLDVLRNVRADNSAGKVPTYVDRSQLDHLDPGWHMAPQSSVIQHWMYDNREPLTMLVYPPAKAGVKLDVMTADVPARIDELTDQLPISDVYLNAVLAFTLAKYYATDVEYSANPGLAAGHTNMGLAMLGQKTSKDFALSPDANIRGAQPAMLNVSGQGGG